MPTDKTPSREALERVAKLITEANIPGLRAPKRLLEFANGRLGGGGNITAKYEIAFAVEATLYVSLEFAEIRKGTALKGRVEIGAPSTQRNITQQLAMNSLLTRMTELGAIIQVYLDSIDIAYMEPETKEK